MFSRRALLAAALGLVAIAGGWAVRPMLFRSTSTPAKADAGLEACHALLKTFDAYPLVYLGDAYEGLPLVHCERRQASGTAYGIPPTDQVFFVYGTCTPTGNDAPSCAPPLQVHVYPACGPIPQAAANSEQAQVRGVGAYAISRDSVFADAVGYHVTISAAQADPSLNSKVALRAFDSLRGANAAASAITSHAPLNALASAQALKAACH